MNILRTLLIGLATFIYVTALSGEVYLLTLQTTVMDRAVVKGWLSDSKIYDGKLVSAFTQTATAEDQKGSDQAQSAIKASPEAVKTALSTTFTPNFIQTQSETVIDNAYDWVEGKTPTFAFSIPVDQKRDMLIQQLTKAMEPQIAALPVCQSAPTADNVCRPPQLTVEQFSSQLVNENLKGSDTFTKPITEKSSAKDSQQPTAQPPKSPLTQLPTLYSLIHTLLIVFPVAILVSIGAIVLAAQRGQRLRTFTRLSRRIFFGMIFTFIIALIGLAIAHGNDFGISGMIGQQASEAAAILVPLVQLVVASIMSRLALLSGIVCVVSLSTWIGLHIWQKRLQQPETPQIVEPPQPTPPTLPQVS